VGRGGKGRVGAGTTWGQEHGLASPSANCRVERLGKGSAHRFSSHLGQCITTTITPGKGAEADPSYPTRMQSTVMLHPTSD
jgi:hypothetical protein